METNGMEKGAIPKKDTSLGQDDGLGEDAGSRETADTEKDAGPARLFHKVTGVNLVRICFLVVFVVNVQCALSFIIQPAGHVGAYGLSGTSGIIALQGLGIAFLMWNATYPAFIASPQRFRVLGWVVLAQQVIGLVGESVLYWQLPAAEIALHGSVGRFISFDAFGLVIMAISFDFMLFRCRKRKASAAG